MTAPVRLAAPGEAAGGCGAARRRRVLADQLRERRVAFSARLSKSAVLASFWLHKQHKKGWGGVGFGEVTTGVCPLGEQC